MYERATMAKVKANHDSSAIYGFGMIGAAVYYISTATSFWMGFWGVIKALVWPGFLVYGLMEFLKL